MGSYKFSDFGGLGADIDGSLLTSCNLLKCSPIVEPVSDSLNDKGRCQRP